jgi:single-strand DNA-binding protein
MTAPTPTLTPEPENLNEVTLVGRVSGDPERRDLPSGDALVTLRVVVDRPPQKKAPRSTQRNATSGTAKRAVDVIDVACWSKRTQRTASGLEAGDGVRVEGALRRRFFAAGGGRASRYEVEAVRLVRVSRAAGPPGR